MFKTGVVILHDIDTNTYKVKYPGGIIRCTVVNRSDSLIFNEGEEVVFAMVEVGSGLQGMIFGLRQYPVSESKSKDDSLATSEATNSSGIIGKAVDERSDIAIFKDIKPKPGDIIQKARFGDEPALMALLSDGFAVLQGGYSSFAFFTGAGYGSITSNRLDINTSAYSEKVLQDEANNTTISKVWLSSTTASTPFMESQVGYTAEAPRPPDDLGGMEGVWLRMSDWLCMEMDDSGKSFKLSITDSFVNNKFTSALTKNVKLTRESINITYGTSSISIDANGIKLKAGTAELSLSSIDNTIELSSPVSASIKSGEKSFVTVSSSATGIAGSSEVAIAPRIRFAQELSYNRAGMTPGVPNFMYNSASDSWNLLTGFTVKGIGLVNTSFLTTKWSQLMTALDSHQHVVYVGAGAITSLTPVMPIYTAQIGYKPIDAKFFTSSQI